MNILIARSRLLARVESSGDGIEPALDVVTLLECQNIRVVQRHCPRLRQLDIEWPQTKIDTDRAVERVELRRWSTGESTAPQLMRLCRCIGEGHRRHAI